MQKKHEPDNFLTRLDAVLDEEALAVEAWIARERAEYEALVSAFGFDTETCEGVPLRFSVPVENISI